MSRMPVEVRPLSVDDGPALHALWAPLLPHDVTGSPPQEFASHVLGMLSLEPEATVVVARLDGNVVGAAYLHRTWVAPLAGAHTLEVNLLAVDPAHTRRGIGRALLEAAVSRAEELGIDDVVVVGAPANREAHRFLARLGLTTVAVLRTAPVSALRTRLVKEHGGLANVQGVPRRNRQVGQVIAARRSQLRSRSRHGVR